jgi:ribosomal protein S18 acetylase RimI-like enzyme
MDIEIRKTVVGDLEALTRFDLTYPTDQHLSLKRAGTPPELSFVLRHDSGDSQDALYQRYTRESFARAFDRVDLFLTGLVDGQPGGFVMVVVPQWTDAGEITDLAVHSPLRRRGLARGLVMEAAAWARERDLRALWVEPRTNNMGAIRFYLTAGFRLSGFNDRMYSNLDDRDGEVTLYMYLELP